MVYLYDNCIVDDLIRSFNPNSVDNPVVKVIGPEAAIGLAAQIKNDEISLPVVLVDRDPGVSIDTNRTNFTRSHLGVQSILDAETNELYYERAIPIQLEYKLTILTSNTADMDEIVKELLFKYTSMYFFAITSALKRTQFFCPLSIRF